MEGWNGGYVQQARGITNKWGAMCENVTIAWPTTLPNTETLELLDAKYQLLGETMKLLAVPTVDDAESYAASVTSCAVIPANCANPEGGYALARWLMDEGGNGFGFPVCKETVSALLEGNDRPYAAQLQTLFDNLTEVHLYEPFRMESDLDVYLYESDYAMTGEDFPALVDKLQERVEHFLLTEDWIG